MSVYPDAALPVLIYLTFLSCLPLSNFADILNLPDRAVSIPQKVISTPKIYISVGFMFKIYVLQHNFAS